MSTRLLLLLALLLSLPLQAQLVPAGSQLRVDTGDDRNPVHVDVSMAADGSYLVVWSYFQDFSSFDCSPGAIYGRRFDREGRPVAPAFVVVHAGHLCVQELRLGPLVQGRRLLVWRAASGNFSPTDLRVIAIDASGRATRVKRTFNANTTADVIPLRSGGLLAVHHTQWARQSDLRGERFDALGRPVGKPFVIARDPGLVYGVDAAETLGSDLAVSWISYDAADRPALLARTLNAKGNPKSGIFQVNDEPGFEFFGPRVESDASGGFAIAWSSGDFGGTDPAPRVHAKLYQPDGTPRSLQLELTPGQDIYHNLEDAALGGGQLLAVWSVPLSSEQENHLPVDDIGASLLETDGELVDLEEPLSEDTGGLQRRTAVSTDRKGLWAVAWAGDGPEGRGIYTRLFTSQP